uniref:Uncharacterized protein n=1 Tax=Heterorhabditis bacteriophora TaxID=37862 RepID=A0A1I7WJW3_HETBA
MSGIHGSSMTHSMLIWYWTMKAFE